MNRCPHINGFNTWEEVEMATEDSPTPWEATFFGYPGGDDTGGLKEAAALGATAGEAVVAAICRALEIEG